MITANFSFKGTLAGAIVEYPHVARGLQKNGLRPYRVQITGDATGEDPEQIRYWVNMVLLALRAGKNEKVIKINGFTYYR